MGFRNHFRPVEHCILNFHGLVIRVSSPDARVIDHLSRDFAFFSREQQDGVDLQLEAYLRTPDFHLVPDCEASYIGPRNVVYNHGDQSFYDYFGQALLVERPGSAVASSEDIDLLREVFYLYILSKVGLHLDKRGLHRLHAAAFSHRGKASLLLCPSGGGKSTTTFHLLSKDGYGLVSEDSPLVGSSGEIHPFPMCLGCKGKPPPDVPKRFLRTISRMEFDPKTLIDLEYFKDKIEQQPLPPGAVLIGIRHSGPTSEIEPTSRLGLFKFLLRDLVIGMGIFQGVEFLFRNRISGLVRHSIVMASRLRSAVALSRRGDPYIFRMGRDIDRNIETLDRFLASGPEDRK